MTRLRALSGLGGLGVLLGSMVVAPVVVAAPAPENRGMLPVFGYTVDQTGVATVYYYAPKSLPAANANPPPACGIAPRIDGLGSESVVVGVDLMWAPKNASDLPHGGECRADDAHALESRALVVGPVSDTAKLSTPTPPNFPFPTAPLVRYATPPPAHSGW